MNAEEFKKFHAQMIEANRFLSKGLDKIGQYEDQIKKELTLELKGYPFRLIPLISSGCLTATWQPNVDLVAHKDRNGLTFIRVKGRGWVWAKLDYDLSEVYSHRIPENQPPPPFDVAELEAKLARLTEAYGFPVDIFEYKMKTTGTFEKYPPQNSDDLLLLHPGGKILASGTISYMGWDCSDKWFFVLDSSNKVTLYYGTTGHGGGLNKVVPHGGDYLPFLGMMDDRGYSVTNQKMFHEVVQKYGGSQTTLE